MKSTDTRRPSIPGSIAALLITGVSLAGCSNSGHQNSPTTTPTTPTTTSTTVPSATEKSISPTGGNLFTPPARATPAPNVGGGRHPGINGIP